MMFYGLFIVIEIQSFYFGKIWKKITNNKAKDFRTTYTSIIKDFSFLFSYIFLYFDYSFSNSKINVRYDRISVLTICWYLLLILLENNSIYLFKPLGYLFDWPWSVIFLNWLILCFLSVQRLDNSIRICYQRSIIINSD